MKKATVGFHRKIFGFGAVGSRVERLVVSWVVQA